MDSKFLVKLIIALIFVVLIGTPLFYLKAGIYPYILSKTLFFQSVVELLFFSWLLLVFFDKHYRPRLTPLIKSLLVFLAALIFTSLFGADFYRSFWSTYERMFGIFTIFHLAALALVISSLSDAIPWRKLLYASLATIVLVDILAVLQLKIPNVLLEEPAGRPGSTFGNPTFFAGYLVFHIFIALYFLIDHYRSRTIKGKGSAALPYFFFAGSLIFNLVVLFLTQTRGDILGLVIGLLVLLTLLFFRPPDFGRILRQGRIYLGLIALMFALAITFWFTRGSPAWSVIPGAGRFRDISTSSLGLQPRLVALRSAWKGFLDRPLTGWGWDNFNVVYNKYYDPRTLEISYQETRLDKPHNFFMEDMATGGIILTLAHLTLLLLLIAEASKLKDKILGQIVVAFIVAYFIRSLLIFDTIGPDLMLYVFLGLVDGWRRKDVLSEGATSPKKYDANEGGTREVKIGPLPACIVLIFSLIVVYELNVPTALASYLEFNAFLDLGHGRPLQGLENFRNSLDAAGPYRWNFARDFSAVITQDYFYNPGVIPQEAAFQAIREMEAVARAHPSDAYNHYALVDMYNQASDLDPDFLRLAEKEAAIALELSPDRQEVYFSLAKTQTIKKDYPAALVVLKKALALDDKVPDAHFYYGIVLYAEGDWSTGYKELKTAINMGRKWKNLYEPRTTADFFADSGHLDEAIDLYKKALEMGFDEIETKIKIGVAYFYANQYDLARKYLGEAGKKFDFKKSPSYPGLKPILDKLGISL